MCEEIAAAVRAWIRKQFHHPVITAKVMENENYGQAIMDAFTVLRIPWGSPNPPGVSDELDRVEPMSSLGLKEKKSND